MHKVNFRLVFKTKWHRRILPLMIDALKYQHEMEDHKKRNVRCPDFEHLTLV
ncbi:MAG: hypothetical protein JEZ03_08340 [Bacteroidales bacterium]|nr:hypothetical protein [Bacteroidales bacterium]